jgi:hypothetical protein
MLLIALCCIVPSCRPECDSIAPQPRHVYFRIIDHSDATDINSAALYWYEHGQQYYMNDEYSNLDMPPFRLDYSAYKIDPLTGQTIADSTKPLLMCYTLVNIATSRNVGRFYIEYSNKSTDTLDVQLKQMITGDGACESQQYVISDISQNGRKLQPDTGYVPYLDVYGLDKW